MVSMSEHPLIALQREIVVCQRCPRLREHCIAVAKTKRRAWLDQNYWGKPVPSWGDPDARLLILGLAPGAHGANRTGRMFTGDSSGDFLYPVLHATGFASQPQSVGMGDGLALLGAWMTACAHCAPPGNKPVRSEIAACRTYLERELQLLSQLRVVVALGRIAFENYLDVLRHRGAIPGRAGFVFEHNKAHETGKGHPVLITSYHPSQQNTSTGRLTKPMLMAVFQRAAVLVRG
jgi:uracil-DNA glycosylase family 4